MTRVQKQRWHEPITAHRDPHDEALLLDILGLTPTGSTAISTGTKSA